VYSITCTQTGNIVSGGKDGRVAVWNIKSPSKPEKIIDLNSFAVFPDWEVEICLDVDVNSAI
jgi:ribosomal protein S26